MKKLMLFLALIGTFPVAAFAEDIINVNHVTSVTPSIEKQVFTNLLTPDVMDTDEGVLMLAQAPTPSPAVSAPAAPSPTAAAVAPAPAAAPAPADAVVPEVKDEEVPGLITTILQAVKDKNWTLLVSAVIMLLIFLANRLWFKTLDAAQKAKYLPWMAVGVAALLQFAALLKSSGSWGEALNGAFVTGAVAAGLWSLIGKYLFDRFLPKPNAEASKDGPK